MRVLLIDPTGIAYSVELARSLGTRVDLTFISRRNEVEKLGISGSVQLLFHDNNKKRFFSKIHKGFNYLFALYRIIRLVRRNKYDTIHIQWLLLPQIDIYFLKQLKKQKCKLVFTAHNVLPHTNSEKYVEVNRILYGFFDCIVVHGQSVKQEFLNLYPEYEQKIRIEHHGVLSSLSRESDSTKIPHDVIERIKKAQKVCLFFGNMFYNKGVDALVSYWLKNLFNNPAFFLVVVGKMDPDYKELIALESQITTCSNLYYYPQIIEENELNAFLELSNIVLLPYRHASMSGVVFKASELSVPVLTTNTGSIKEYLTDNSAFCVDKFDEFFEKLDYVLKHISNEELKRMGEVFKNHIEKEYSWDRIAEDTVEHIYN